MMTNERSPHELIKIDFVDTSVDSNVSKDKYIKETVQIKDLNEQEQEQEVSVAIKLLCTNCKNALHEPCKMDMLDCGYHTDISQVYPENLM